MSARFFQPGEKFVTRDVHRGRLRAAVATTVVEDTAERTVLYLQQGAEFCLPANAEGVLTKDLTEATQLLPLRWEGHDFARRAILQEQIAIALTGDAHAVLLRRSGVERTIDEWYVNLQAPFRRSGAGFDTTDHALDLILSPDLSSHRWKDEDERVLAHAARRDPPFDHAWEEWRPCPEWVAPDVRVGWDVV